MHTPSIHHRFDGVARALPGRVALHTPARDTTFGELRDGSDQVAGALAELGCASPDRIAILAGNHATIVAGMLGVLKAGCVFAPLEVAEPDDRLDRLLGRLAPRAILVDAAGRARLPERLRVLLADGSLGGRALPIVELDGARPIQTPTALRIARTAAPDAPCSIYFTSGSTGEPRAIVGRLAGIDHHIAWELDFLGADPGVRGSVLHAPSYDAYLPDVLVPMCAGGVACAPAERGVVLDPARLCAWLEQADVTLLHCVPSLFRGLVARPEAARLTGLGAVLLAGEVVRPADVRAARAALGDRVRLVNLYGPTEATLVKLHHELTAADADGDAVPIGVPMPGVTVHVYDDDGQPCPDGEIGQIAIQSAYGSLGYLDEPELTRERFLSARGGSGQQIYLTGDRGRRLPGGALAFHGRRDRQIKLCGARVDLDEVEAILCSCDGVAEAAVVAAEGEIVLHGFVVLAGGAAMARVREQAMQRLGPAMRLAWLTRLDALPRTSSGKIDRRRIAEAHAAARP